MAEDDLRRRIARANELLAVPHRAPFAQRVYDGVPLTDEQIDYLALPHRFALCDHFRPHPGHFPLPPGIKRQDIERSSPRDDDDHVLLTCPACAHQLVATGNGTLWPPQ